jgi:acyl-CoA hydrolase
MGDGGWQGGSRVVVGWCVCVGGGRRKGGRSSIKVVGEVFLADLAKDTRRLGVSRRETLLSLARKEKFERRDLRNNDAARILKERCEMKGRGKKIKVCVHETEAKRRRDKKVRKL